MKPGSHDKLHVSPALGPPLAPSSQSTVPFPRIRGQQISATESLVSHLIPSYTLFIYQC